MISDTILICNGIPQLLTDCTRKLAEISYFFKSTSKKNKSKKSTDDSDEEYNENDSDDNSEGEEEKMENPQMDVPVGRKMRTRSRTGHAKIDEEAMRRRDSHQSGLLKRLVRDSLLKYTQEADDSSNVASSMDAKNSTALKNVECYKKDAFLPKGVRDLKVFWCHCFS